MSVTSELMDITSEANRDAHAVIRSWTYKFTEVEDIPAFFRFLESNISIIADTPGVNEFINAKAIDAGLSKTAIRFSSVLLAAIKQVLGPRLLEGYEKIPSGIELYVRLKDRYNIMTNYKRIEFLKTS